MMTSPPGRRRLTFAGAAAFVLSTTGLGACGDALVEQGFRGEPRLTFTGQIATANGDTTTAGPLRAALFWSQRGTTALDATLVEQPAVSVAVQFPGTFEINVFDPPPDVAWTSPTAGYRVALVLIYEDVDADGRLTFDGTETTELRGGAQNQAVLWAERSLGSAESPTGNALLPGYHAVHLPMPCAVIAPPTRGADCGVPLGAACTDDTNCGTGGRCLTQDAQTFWPGGYCIAPALVGGCEPNEGVLRRTRVDGTEAAFWHRRCETAADCRADAGYTCLDDACYPGAPAALVLDRNLVPAALCAAFEAGEGHDGPER